LQVKGVCGKSNKFVKKNGVHASYPGQGNSYNLEELQTVHALPLETPILAKDARLVYNVDDVVSAIIGYQQVSERYYCSGIKEGRSLRTMALR
jgi:hypothetical protein